ncbi:hypothetical protein AWB80_04369 [Caballeronia pedi]|uniref:Uncharacterized protein n=1 Tax=Caballeronia pedi TaxID=1777141 RepID=A0A158C078_9BURK|nr:hypothetical protein AWB80_04369 [Caballeronia pedi]
MIEVVPTLIEIPDSTIGGTRRRTKSPEIDRKGRRLLEFDGPPLRIGEHRHLSARQPRRVGDRLIDPCEIVGPDVLCQRAVRDNLRGALSSSVIEVVRDATVGVRGHAQSAVHVIRVPDLRQDLTRPGVGHRDELAGRVIGRDARQTIRERDGHGVLSAVVLIGRACAIEVRRRQQTSKAVVCKLLTMLITCRPNITLQQTTERVIYVARHADIIRQVACAVCAQLGVAGNGGNVAAIVVARVGANRSARVRAVRNPAIEHRHGDGRFLVQPTDVVHRTCIFDLRNELSRGVVPVLRYIPAAADLISQMAVRIIRIASRK